MLMVNFRQNAQDGLGPRQDQGQQHCQKAWSGECVQCTIMMRGQSLAECLSSNACLKQARQARMGLLVDLLTALRIKRNPHGAGERKNVLLSPMVSRRLSGFAPEVAVSSEHSPPPCRSSISRSDGRICSTAAASAVTGHIAAQTTGSAVPVQPASGLLPEDSTAATVPDSLAEAAAVEDEPAPPAKRRRRTCGVTSAAAVPVPHHHGSQAKAAYRPVDKLFSDGAAKVERLQWVHCDRCGKWRLLDPHYQASLGPADINRHDMSPVGWT
jgi:hypothetical protein